MWFVTSLASIATAVGGHALARRAFSRGAAVSSFVPFVLLAGGVGACWLYATYGWSSQAAAGLLVFVLGCELYVFLFTLVAHSISATLLLALRNGPRTLGDLESLCSPVAMVEKRKAQMVDVGLLSKGPSGYRVTGKGLALLRSFEMLNAFFFPTRHRG